jgi:hypothetical protein
VHVGLPNDDRTGALQPFDDRRVAVGDVLRERRIAPGGAHPRDVETVLDRHRHPMQRPAPLGRQRVGSVCLCQGVFGADLDHCVDLRVGRDPREELLRHLARRDLTCADPLRDLSGCEHATGLRSDTVSESTPDFGSVVEHPSDARLE